MATKLQKMATKLNEDFRDVLKDAVRDRFGIEVESEFSIFLMRLVTSRTDGQPFTEEENAFIAAFSDGYGSAMDMVRESA